MTDDMYDDWRMTDDMYDDNQYCHVYDAQSKQWANLAVTPSSLPAYLSVFLDCSQGYILTTGTLANTNYIAIPINAANKLAAVVSANYLARWTSGSLTDPSTYLLITYPLFTCGLSQLSRQVNEWLNTDPPPRSICLDISSHIIPFLSLLFVVVSTNYLPIQPCGTVLSVRDVGGITGNGRTPFPVYHYWYVPVSTPQLLLHI